MPFDKRADARSKETEFSGLPKAIKLITDVTVLGGAAAFQIQLYDRIVYNYGGYAVTNTGAFLSTVIIPEPGVYYVEGQSACIANSQSFASYIGVNGAFADGIQHYFQSGGPASLVNPVWQVRGDMQLKAGDAVTINWAQPNGGVAQNGLAGFHWMYVEKRGGQY